MLSLRSVGSRIAAKIREVRRLSKERKANAMAHGLDSYQHKAVYRQLQNEAATRPESRRVPTSTGDVWMSPIEFQLYEAMHRKGLSPVPQFCVHGYYVDFAFPEIRLAIEADGAAYHREARLRSDHKRDWILGRYGWNVLRFQGTTIYRKADSCAYVIGREVARGRSAREPVFR